MSAKSSASARGLGGLPRLIFYLILSTVANGRTSPYNTMVNCRLDETRRVLCYISLNTSGVCFCQDVSNTQDPNDFCAKKKINLTIIKIHINSDTFTLSDVKTIARNPTEVSLNYNENISNTTIVPSTFSNVRSIKELTIVGRKIYSISTLSFGELINLISLNITNTSIKYLPLNMFVKEANLKKINLSFNGIRTILPKTFDIFFFLESLDLSNNIISCLTRDSFSGLGGLKFLDLSHNRLENLTSFLFSELWDVEEIKLDFNYIQKINQRTFESLAHLRKLSLKDNFLSSIPLGTFYGAREVRHLDLSDNNLYILSSQSMEPIMKNFEEFNSSLQLDGNQLTCCHLEWVRELIANSHSISVKKSLTNLTCHRTDSVTKVYEFNVDPTDLLNHCLALLNSSCHNCNDELKENIIHSTMSPPVLYIHHYHNLNCSAGIHEIAYNYSYQLNTVDASTKPSMYSSFNKEKERHKEPPINSASLVPPMLIMIIAIVSIVLDKIGT